jgi:signal transduction histidine kinase
MILTRIHSDYTRKKEVSLEGLLQNVIETIKEKIKRTGAVIDYGQLPVIHGNEGQLFYLFKNLLSNAIKFQNTGNIPHIHITAKKVMEASGIPGEKAIPCYQVSFTDNGLGFDPKFTSKIFQVFQRLHTQEEYEGTGMGLAICKKVMETHGGTIRVESVPGKGSVFHCYFPINRE